MKRRIENTLAIVLGFAGFLGLLGDTEGSSLSEVILIKLFSLFFVVVSLGITKRLHPSLWEEEEV